MAYDMKPTMDQMLTGTAGRREPLHLRAADAARSWERALDE
jgi:hypothetical protein